MIDRKRSSEVAGSGAAGREHQANWDVEGSLVSGVGARSPFGRSRVRRFLGGGSFDHRRSADDDAYRSAKRDLLGYDSSREAGQRRHVIEAEPDADPAKIVGTEATVQAAPGHSAHLVVQLRPADPAPVIAEPYELDGIRVRGVCGGSPWNHRWRALPPISGRGRQQPIDGP